MRAFATRAPKVAPLWPANSVAAPSHRETNASQHTEPTDVVRTQGRVRSHGVGSRIGSMIPILVIASGAIAQPWITYDASLGTLPSEQCFSPNHGQNVILEVVGGVLHQSTLGPASGNVTDHYFDAWERPGYPESFAAGFTMEMVVRSVTAHASTTTSVLRTGLSMLAHDSTGRFMTVWFNEGSVTLVNDNLAPTRGLSATTPFPNDGLFHTYRARTDVAGMHLDIDGVNLLNLPLGITGEVAPGIVTFGDTTEFTGANGEFFIRSFRFTGVGTGPITGITGPDPAVTCPTSPASFTAIPSGTAPYTYQWQWRPQGASAWLNITNGVNTDPLSGEPAFNAFGASGVTVTTTNSVGNSVAITGGRREIHVIVSNDCGSVTSDAATWSICPADFDCDGFVTGEDFDGYVAAFETGNLVSDFDQNGFVTGEDFDAFVMAFEGGC